MSVHGRGGCLVSGGCLVPRGLPGPGGCLVPEGGLVPGGGEYLVLGRGAWSRGVGIPAYTEADPPSPVGEAATAADVTHPTGMHSRFFISLAGYLIFLALTFAFSWCERPLIVPE